MWNEVWNTVHNFLSTNKTKTAIWQQIHLNFYTQYSYNKWHKKQDICPLCHEIPENIYHVILHCNFVNDLWAQIEPLLKELHPTSVTEEEKAFGIIQKNKTTGILLRNWLTYLLRENILEEERAAHFTLKKTDIEKAKQKFNNVVESEILIKAFRYKNEQKLEFFDKIITHAEILCKKKEEGEYEIRHIYT